MLNMNYSLINNNQKRNGSAISFFNKLPMIISRKKRMDRITRLSQLSEIGKMSSGIFHDLLNPLTSLTLYIEALSKKEKTGTTEIRKYLKHVTKSSKQMGDFIGLIKTYMSECEISKKFNVESEIRKVIELMGYKAIKSNISINFIRQSDSYIEGNPLKFYQIIINLISNSIDSYKESDVLKKKIVITSIKNKDNIFLTIKDYGQGISKEHIKNIFKPFYTTKPAGSGTGIGLATVRHIIENDFNGSVEVKSEPFKGSLFSIKIPLK
jgi:signal transduction histidine kinase